MDHLLRTLEFTLKNIDERVFKIADYFGLRLEYSTLELLDNIIVEVERGAERKTTMRQESLREAYSVDNSYANLLDHWHTGDIQNLIDSVRRGQYYQDEILEVLEIAFFLRSHHKKD